MRLQKYFFTNNNELVVTDTWDPLRIAGVAIGCLGCLLGLVVSIVALLHNNLHNLFDFSVTPLTEISSTIILSFIMGCLIYVIEVSLMYGIKSTKSIIKDSSDVAFGLLVASGSAFGMLIYGIYGFFAEPLYLGAGDVKPLIYIKFIDSRVYLVGMGLYIVIHSFSLICIETFRKRGLIFSRDDAKNILQMRNEFYLIPFKLKGNRTLESDINSTVTLAIFQKISGRKIKHIPLNVFNEQNEPSNIYVLAAYDPIKYKLNSYTRIFNGPKIEIMSLLDKIQEFGALKFYDPGSNNNIITF